jgi:hypothetical protein
MTAPPVVYLDSIRLERWGPLITSHESCPSCFGIGVSTAIIYWNT